MEHAKKFSEFIPSEEEMNYYVKLWRNPQNIEYVRFRCLEQEFHKKAMNRTTLFNKCVLLNLSYSCMSYVDYGLIVSHLLEKMDDSNCKKLLSGDREIVDVLRNVNTGKTSSKDLYVFATMFCHHSTPQAYYGFSRPIARTLYAINQNRSFADIDRRCKNLWNYDTFCNVMSMFCERFQINNVSKTYLDVMLRGIYKDFSKDINNIWRG